MKKLSQYDVFFFAFGNFLAYIPLSMMTRMSSKGLFASLDGTSVTSFELLPLYALGNMLTTLIFFYVLGWYSKINFTTLLKIPFPKIRWYIYLSGLCTLLQIATALWAYAFTGISLVFVILLMKGGTLIMSPLIDLMIKKRKRTIYWPSLVAACLSLLALIVSFAEKADTAITVICLVDIFLYLCAYFFKLTIMSIWAKSSCTTERRQFIIEEQMVIILLGYFLILPLMALVGVFYQNESVFHQILNGFTKLPAMGFIIPPMVIGSMSVCAGIFASHVFLDRRENTFCLAAAQSSTILGGTIAGTLLAIYYNQPPLSFHKFIGILLIIGAIAFLAYRGKVEKKKEKIRHLALVQDKAS